MVRSQTHGKSTSITEVTNISSHGIWLFSHGNEWFISYEHFPWFKERPVGQLINVQEVSPGHFFWPDLDVDLGIETIEHPERFPLKSGQA